MNQSDTNESIKLLALNPAVIGPIPHEGNTIPARLIKIIDGDTLDVIIMLGNYPLQIRIRLHGLDAPETKLRSGVRQLEKDAGLKVKKYVCSIYNKVDIVYITLLGLDKYGGRYVGTIQHPILDKTLNEHLKEMRYVKSYDGRSKIPWVDSDLNYIIKCIDL